MKINFLPGTVLIASLMTAMVAVAQESKVALPMVCAAEVPLYPPGGVRASVEGLVHVKVITDGDRVTTATAEKGSIPMLARAAEANAKTWRFAIHEPTSFTITYRYKLVTDLDPHRNNDRVIMNLPEDVEVDALRWTGTMDFPVESSPVK